MLKVDRNFIMIPLLLCFWILDQFSEATLPVRVSLSSPKQCLSPITELPRMKEILEAYYSGGSCRRCATHYLGTWTQIGFLDMTDSSQSCPSAWATTINTTVRGCGREPSSSGSCDSVFYSSQGTRYSQVCGHIKAYQYGATRGFIFYNYDIDSWYIHGVSLTHGLPGSRTHVWSFVNAYYELFPYFGAICPCMLSNSSTWPHSIPSFVGNNYFCATGSQNEPDYELLTDNPLWDGEGCTGVNTCCQFNHPPWFCRTLPEPTTDDLEVRICANWGTAYENTYISNLELYIR